MKKRVRCVRVVEGVPIVDLRWPDGIRTRKVMPSESKASEIAIRFRSARVDGTWRELRAKLDMDERSDGLTFDELKEIYLREYVKSYNRDYDSKESRLRILGHTFNGPVGSFTQRHVTEFVSARKKQRAANRTINRDLIVLCHMLEWARKENYITVNTLQDVQKLKEVQWEGQRPTDEIVNAVFDKLDPRVIPLFTFLRETGCRREEALSLEHKQLDLTAGEVVFWGHTKSGRSRRVPLTKRAIGAINAMPRASKYVFYHPNSLTRWDTCKKPWETARVAAKHPWLRIHDLRHAYGIRLAEAGCPMHFISEVLGHASVDFTRRQYAKFSPESASKAVLLILEKGRKRAVNAA